MTHTHKRADVSAAPPAVRINAQIPEKNARSGEETAQKPEKDVQKPADSAQDEETAAEDAPEKNALSGFVPVTVTTGTFLGKDAKEKRAIFERLTAYKKSHGLGCCRNIADAANGALSAEDVREMLDAGKRPTSAWKIVDAALDYLENKENQNG